MKHLMILLACLMAFVSTAQISTKRDSTNQIILVSTITQPDGGVLTVESAGVDTATVRDRLLSSLLDTYGTIARLEDELRELNGNATQMRGIYSQFDTTNYFTRTANLYAPSLYAQYTFRQNATTTTVEFRANAQGSPIAATGSTRGTIRIYAPNYIEVRGYFKNAANTVLDVFFCKKGDTWVGIIDGRKITLKRKK